MLSNNDWGEIIMDDDKEKKDDDTEAKLEVPRVVIDPRLEDSADFTQKPEKKNILNKRKEDL